MNLKLQTVALTIWWCEGTKARKDKRWKNAYSRVIEVTNTNPKIIAIFLDYLRNNLNIPNEKIHGQVQINEGDNKKEIESFWSQVSDIPILQFNKTIIRKKGKKLGKTKGTFKIRLYDKKVFERLEKLLELELEETSSRGVA